MQNRRFQWRLPSKSVEAKSAAIGAVIEGVDSTAVGSIAGSLQELPADGLPPAKKGTFLRKALGKWSEFQPADAARFLDASQLGGRDLMGARRSVAENWAASDPQAALAWVQGQGGPQEVRIVMSGLITGWLDKDPRAAEAYVASHIDSLGPEVSTTLAVRLFHQDPQYAKDWVNRLSNVQARRTADSFIAMEAASTDPKGASEWAASLPEDVRDRAIGGAVTAWAKKDPLGTEQWLNGLTGSIRDEAINAYSSSVSSSNPAAALAWTTRITNGEMRETSVQRIVGGWLRRNPNDATVWIQNSALPDAEKVRLLSLPRGR